MLKIFATVTSFSQPQLSFSSGCSRSFKHINRHYVACYSRSLIQGTKKCKKLPRFFVVMENFTCLEKHVGEILMGKSQRLVFVMEALFSILEPQNRVERNTHFVFAHDFLLALRYLHFLSVANLYDRFHKIHLMPPFHGWPTTTTT